MSLIEDFGARNADIEKQLENYQIDFGDARKLKWPVDLKSPASAFFAEALDLERVNFTSWLPGMPLAALLATGRSITVDIAPAFLDSYRRNYGISEDALIAFAREGMLHLNIRDFDPTASLEQQQREAIAYAPYERLLKRIFDEVPRSTYFLASLRPRLFDAVPTYTGPRSAPKPSMVSVFADAERQLAGAAAASRRLSSSDKFVLRASFRTEFPHERATYWHWAYVQAVIRIVDPEFARYLLKDYEWLANEGQSAPRDASADFELGTRFIAFQMRMRYAHLLYSAPLSASFGGPYGYSLDDDHVYLQAVERQFAWKEDTPFEYDFFDDDLLDLIKDLQLGVLRPRFSDLIKPRHVEALSTFGVEVLGRTEQTAYFDHYQEETNRGELIAYWHGVDKTLNYQTLELQYDELLGRDGLEPRDLIELVLMKEEMRTAADRALRKATEGFQTLTTAAHAARLPGQVRSTDPKEPHLLMRLLIQRGLKTGNGGSAAGKQGDYSRRAYSAGNRFRNPPM